MNIAKVFQLPAGLVDGIELWSVLVIPKKGTAKFFPDSAKATAALAIIKK